jgi:lipoate-protein ligase A
MTEPQLFDPEVIRGLDRRTVFVRTIRRPTLVLGSTQDESIVDLSAVARHGVERIRRRSGGGAVLLEPDLGVWIDTWVPRADPLWSDDITRSSAWVGEWWVESLELGGFEVHRGPAITSRWSDLICFAGVGAGEVVRDGRKLVGVAQWRSRQGALFHSLAYIGIDWSLLAELVNLGSERAEAALELEASTVGLGELGQTDAAGVTSALLGHLPDPDSWEVGQAPG